MGILGAASTYTVHYADWLKILAAAESTLPKTKMVNYWLVEYARYGEPGIIRYGSGLEADNSAAEMRRGDHLACIRVTGPHLQEVPA